MMTSYQNTTGSLFPSASISSTESASTAQNLKWLENKSFTSETAKKVVQFQQELKTLQSSRAESDDSDEDSDDDCALEKQHQTPVYVVPGASRVAVEPTTIQDINVENRHMTSLTDCSYKKKKKRRKYDSYDEDIDDSHSKKKKNKHRNKKKHKKERRKSKETKEIEIPGLLNCNMVFLDEVADIAPDHAFKIDRKPDTNSWAYGSLYSGHVAKYKSAGNQCVGSERYQLIDMKDKKRKEKIISDRYYSRENRKVMNQPPVEVMNSSKQENNIKSDIPVYISLQDVSENMAGAENKDIRQKILDESTSLYILGKSKQAGDDSPVGEAILDPLRLNVADYNKRLRESPSDVKLWLEFVKFQDKFALDDYCDWAESDADTYSRKQTAKGILEKKLNILDKALEFNPGNIELLMAKIEFSSEISDTANTNKELEQLLFVHPANTRLWKYYLTFNQSRLAVFTVTRMIRHYHRCLKTLLQVLEGQVHTHSIPENLEREILEVFVQYCYFLKQAGYKEKAVASFQAEMEYNLFVPPSVKDVSKETKMAAFEEFWDSSCPKIGTTGACGWRKWKEQTSPADDSEESSTDSLEDIENAITEKKLSKHDTWLMIEELREQHHWLPWQSGEGQVAEECEDMERLVVFDDVSPVLFDISEHFHFEFIISFLKFLDIETRSSCCVQFPGYFSENVKELTSYYEGTADGDLTTGPNNDIVKSFAVNLLKFVIPCFREKQKSDLTVILINIQLSQYQEKNPSKSDRKEMKKILKNVLKEEPNRHNLAVWSIYIDLEKSVGKPGEGESIMETALSMYSGGTVESTNERTVGTISLFCQYCEMLLKLEQKSPYKLLPRVGEVSTDTKRRVLSVINCLVEGKKFDSRKITHLSGAAVLKTLSYLSGLCRSLCETVCSTDSKEVSELCQEHFLKLVWCNSLFVYCKSGLSSSIDTYTSVIQSVSGDAKDLFQVERRLYMDMLKIILYHMSTSSSPLHVLREKLDTALQKFPEDDLFLSLYVDVERKSRISRLLNSHFDRWCRTIEAPTPAMFAILFQLELLANLKNSDGYTCHSGVVNRSRALLEHSLALGNLQHSPLLWRLYLEVEKQAGSSGRMKGVFYRAVQQCPWNKNIYMDGVRIFGAEQLQEMVDLMTEKELRLQIPVEELDILISS